MSSATPASTAPIAVASATSGRTTGIPMIARAGDAVLVAWRDGRVRTARVAAVGAHDIEPLSELSPTLSRRHSEVSQRLPSTQWHRRGARHGVIRFLRYLP